MDGANSSSFASVLYYESWERPLALPGDIGAGARRLNPDSPPPPPPRLSHLSGVAQLARDKLSLQRLACSSGKGRFCSFSKIYHQYFFVSKALVLVLLLNALYSAALYGVAGEVLKTVVGEEYFLTRCLLIHGVTQLLFPIGGHVADMYVGRHNVVRFSLWVAWMAFGVLAVAFSVDGLDNNINRANRYVFLPLCFLLLSVSYVCFMSNIIPFGMDQLQGASHVHYSSFFYWWYWTLNIGLVIVDLPEACGTNELTILVQASIGVLCITVALVLDALCKHWFVIEPTSSKTNPLQQIFTISKHILLKSSRPQDQYIPSTVLHELNLAKRNRLELAKKRYGGKYDTEDVENVRTFFQMLAVLFVIGFPIFTYAGVMDTISLLADHMEKSLVHFSAKASWCTVSVSLLDGVNSLLVVTIIPLLDLLVVPLLRYTALNPGILKRVAIGTVLIFASVLSQFVITGVGGRSAVCMFAHGASGTLEENVYWVFVPLVLATLAEILIYIPSFEFISAQSPYSMRGLLVGIFFSIKGLFTLLALLLQYIFTLDAVTAYPFLDRTAMPCSFWYYFTVLAVSLLGLILYCCVSHKYKKRKREDVFNEVARLEEYFSKILVYDGSH